LRHSLLREAAPEKSGAVFVFSTALLFVSCGDPRQVGAMLPWTERNGAVSPLKLTCFLLLCLPAVWIGWDALMQNLGPRPYDEALHRAGLWAVRFLLISLAITPLRRLLRWPKLITLRRQIGLAALFYALLHLTLYAGDQGFLLSKVATEIASRIYLTIGFAALCGLIALGVTSTDSAIRRMGGRNWQRLHRIVYAIAVLALVHYLLQSKRDMTAPILHLGLLAWMFGYRIAYAFGAMQKPWHALPLSAIAGLATVVIEAGWYFGFTKIPVEQVLAANLQFDFRIAPAWWVFAVGLAIAALAWARQAWPLSRPAPSAAE
jgi:sulfoxide reductase heme-binding subunit YedZ